MATPVPHNQPQPVRIASIDQFRGLAIILMVLANFLGGVASVPAWLKHAPDVGLTVIDLIAPFFIFAIGLTYGLSFRRRLKRDGNWVTVWHFVWRWAIIMAIGMVIGEGEILFGMSSSPVDWGVLQAIAAAGLLTMLVLNLPTLTRLGIGLALLASYQLLLNHYWLATVLASAHGGPLGALSWTAMLIIATALADVFHDAQGGRKSFPWIAALILAGGIILGFFEPVSKNRVSSSYVLISLGASALLFWAFYLLVDRARVKLPALGLWGKNPLLLYMLHEVLLGLYALPGIYFPGWYAQAPWELTMAQGLVLLLILGAIAQYCDRRGWILRL
jgi:predicted acyltransferase